MITIGDYMKMQGIIKWFKNKKGYGYIIGSDDDTYFFEIIDCVNLEETFEEGDKVLFIPNFGEFTYASSVEKVAQVNE